MYTYLMANIEIFFLLFSPRNVIFPKVFFYSGSGRGAEHDEGENKQKREFCSAPNLVDTESKML